MKSKTKLSELNSDSHKNPQVKQHPQRLPFPHTKWISNSNESINIKLVENEDQMYNEDGYFHPAYTNQV